MAEVVDPRLRPSVHPVKPVESKAAVARACALAAGPAQRARSCHAGHIRAPRCPCFEQYRSTGWCLLGRCNADAPVGRFRRTGRLYGLHQYLPNAYVEQDAGRWIGDGRIARPAERSAESAKNANREAPTVACTPFTTLNNLAELKRACPATRVRRKPGFVYGSGAPCALFMWHRGACAPRIKASSDLDHAMLLFIDEAPASTSTPGPAGGVDAANNCDLAPMAIETPRRSRVR